MQFCQIYNIFDFVFYEGLTLTSSEAQFIIYPVINWNTILISMLYKKKLSYQKVSVKKYILQVSFLSKAVHCHVGTLLNKFIVSVQHLYNAISVIASLIHK